MRKIITYIYIWLLAIPMASYADDTIRIATWNLGGFHKIPLENLDNIVEGVMKLDADILVLPELNPITHGQVLVDKLSAHECYESAVPDQPKARQEIGYLYRCDIQLTNVTLILGSDLGKRGYRNATVARVVADDFDFYLIGLHLKAARGPANRSLRNQQLAWVNAFAQGVLATGEKDVLVIGDYNMIPGQDQENFDVLNTGQIFRVISSESLEGQGSHVGSHGVGNLLDGYAFTAVDEEEYVEDSISIVQMHELMGMTTTEYKNNVTDHLPVVAEFSGNEDND